MSGLCAQLFTAGVLLVIAFFFIGQPYLESFLAEEDRAKADDEKRYESAEPDAGSPVPTLAVVEHASEPEQLESPDYGAGQKQPIPLAA